MLLTKCISAAHMPGTALALSRVSAFFKYHGITGVATDATALLEQQLAAKDAQIAKLAGTLQHYRNWAMQVCWVLCTKGVCITWQPNLFHGQQLVYVCL